MKGNNLYSFRRLVAHASRPSPRAELRAISLVVLLLVLVGRLRCWWPATLCCMRRVVHLPALQSLTLCIAINGLKVKAVDVQQILPLPYRSQQIYLAVFYYGAGDFLLPFSLHYKPLLSVCLCPCWPEKI